jgi:2,3-bisphosphoglycerate-independent phosphoglycerate mutase
MITDSSFTGGPKLADTIKAMYREGQTDYSFEPIVAVNDQELPIGCIREKDAVIFCCRRGEREIQLTEAFTDPEFNQFTRPNFDQLDFVILTLYHEKFKDLPVAFAPARIKDTLGEAVSKARLRQLRTTESEKFAHVTFFFNGGRNEPFPGEDDIRVPSPKGISFDQVPELSLAQVEKQVTEGIQNGYDLIVTNFTNGDVIGHTSNPEAKIKCAEYVDESLGRVIEAARASGYVTIITADHGNLEEMTNPEGTPHVSHTTNRVPFILLDPRLLGPDKLNDGILADVAPTILSALNIEPPLAMDGTSLAPGYDWGGRRKVLLIILDGWGIGQNDESNPIFLARTQVWDGLIENAPHSLLQAAGEAVGLKEGKAGNSEAGHINLGAGRVVLQDDVRLDRAMQDGSFFTNEVLCNTIESVKERKGCLHLIGLLTEKSSHGSIDYPLAILRMAKDRGIKDVFLHMIFDGRSTEPGSAPKLIEKLDNELKEIGIGIIATGVGRGIALDRDGNYVKTKRAYDAMVSGTGRKFLAE